MSVLNNSTPDCSEHFCVSRFSLAHHLCVNTTLRDSETGKLQNAGYLNPSPCSQVSLAPLPHEVNLPHGESETGNSGPPNSRPPNSGAPNFRPLNSRPHLCVFPGSSPSCVLRCRTARWEIPKLRNSELHLPKLQDGETLIPRHLTSILHLGVLPGSFPS